MTVIAHTDGASRGNPGESGIGVVLATEAGSVLGTIAGSIGMHTNNVAEYTAFLECLKAVSVLPCKRLVVHSDSELMVRQMNGQYKIKDAALKRLAAHARTMIAGAGFSVELRHVLRSANADADKLANGGIDSRSPVRIAWTDAAHDLMSVK